MKMKEFGPGKGAGSMMFHVGILEKIAGMYSTHLIVFLFGMFASIR